MTDRIKGLTHLRKIVESSPVRQRPRLDLPPETVPPQGTEESVARLERGRDSIGLALFSAGNLRRQRGGLAG